MDSNEKWYAVKEVGARYGVSCDTIRRRVKDGIIQAVNFSGPKKRSTRKCDALRISESELQRFERNKKTS